MLLSDFIEIKEGMTWVELGSGTGVFSCALANYVGENGVVYAVDDSNEMLEYIRKKKLPQNMLLLHRDAGDTGLESEIADVCLLAFILQEVNTSDKIINEAYRLLKPNGKVLIVEWKAELTPKGPPVNVRITKDKLKKLFNQSGIADCIYIDCYIKPYVSVGVL